MQARGSSPALLQQASPWVVSALCAVQLVWLVLGAPCHGDCQAPGSLGGRQAGGEVGRQHA